MKKQLLTMALLAMALGSFTGCSKDDDNSTPVTLSQTKYTNKEACNFDISRQANEGIKTTTGNNEVEAPDIKNVSISESGQGMVELNDPVTGEKLFLLGNVTMNENVYTFSGAQVSGTVTKQSAKVRSTNDVTLSINLTITIPGKGKITYSTEGEAVQAVQNVADMAGKNLIALARTWKILEVEVLLKGDVDAFTVAKGGDLRQLRKVAIDAGAHFSASDSLSMEKSILDIDFSANGKIAIRYDNGKLDVADIKNSFDEQACKFKLNLADKGMGGKFLVDNSDVDVILFEDRCNLKFYTNIKEDSGKTYDVTLTVRMQEAK